MRTTPEQTTVLLAGIQPHRVSQLDGMSYVEAWDIRAMLIRIFGYAGWSLLETTPTTLVYEEQTTTKAGKPAWKVAYRANMALVVHTSGGDTSYAGAAVGESLMPDFKRGDAHDMAIKTAESGALKRAAMNLGDQFGLSLYRAGSLDPVVRKLVHG